jgi:Type VI secretion system, TssN
MNALIPIIVLLILSIGSGFVFLWGFDLYQNERRTLRYPLFMLLLGCLAGLGLHYGAHQKDPACVFLGISGIGLKHVKDCPTVTWDAVFTLLQISFLLFGIFHVWYMYKRLFWSKRDPFRPELDSFLPEFIYTICVMFFVSLGMVAVSAYFVGLKSHAGSYWAVSELFMMPFLVVKIYDFFNQIPKQDFSQKWFFTNERINEDLWERINETWTYFEVKETWRDEGLKKGRVANFRIKAPREVPIRELFRLAVREYNRQGHDILVQDLGFEPVNKGRFWWLFSIKTVWNRPDTWFRKIRYLDPDLSTVHNHVYPDDVIVVKRVPVKRNDRSGDNVIPMGIPVD